MGSNEKFGAGRICDGATRRQGSNERETLSSSHRTNNNRLLCYSPDVPRCASAGGTEKEPRRNFQDALVVYFDAMREDRRANPGTVHLRRLRGSRRISTSISVRSEIKVAPIAARPRLLQIFERIYSYEFHQSEAIIFPVEVVNAA
jgi:predicted RNase H-like HicB family nuclease